MTRLCERTGSLLRRSHFAREKGVLAAHEDKDNLIKVDILFVLTKAR